MKAAIVVIVVLCPLVVLATTVQDTKVFVLSADGINKLVATCAAGSFTLSGVAGSQEIRVIARIEVEAQEKIDLQRFIQENVRLTLVRQADHAIFNSAIRLSAAPVSEARINLTLEVPRVLNVMILDGSGPLSVYGLNGDLSIEDDSGSIQIEDIIGNVNIADSSGSIWLEEIRGNVVIDDGSGSITVGSVWGDVQIKDGSGGMAIIDIHGNVTVSDGSGSIDIQDVKKNVSIFIRAEGSGEVNIEGVKGKTTIRP